MRSSLALCRPKAGQDDWREGNTLACQAIGTTLLLVSQTPFSFAAFVLLLLLFLSGELWDRYIWEGSVANLDPYTDTNREDSRAVFVPGAYLE